MKKLIVLLALVPLLCSAQVDSTKWRDWRHYPLAGTLDVPQLTPATPGYTGRIRTINSHFITIYSPNEYKGFCEQREVLIYSNGTVPSVTWEPVLYFRLVGPFKKRKEYKLNEIYVP